MSEAELGPYLRWFASGYVGLTALTFLIAALIWPNFANYAAVPALMGAAMGAAAKFVMDHERPFTDCERTAMTRRSFGLAWAINILASLLLIILQVGPANLGAFAEQVLFALQTPPNGLIAAGSIVVVAALVYALLHFCYGRMAKTFAEQRKPR